MTAAGRQKVQLQHKVVPEQMLDTRHAAVHPRRGERVGKNRDLRKIAQNG
jgi:hypothetical protein